MLKKIQNIFIKNLNKIKKKYPKIIKEIRGRGFLIGITTYIKIKQILLKN